MITNYRLCSKALFLKTALEVVLFADVMTIQKFVFCVVQHYFGFTNLLAEV